MSASITSVTPTSQSETLHPSLDIVLSIRYREAFNIPISILGIVRSEDNRVLGHIFEVPSKNAHQLQIKAFHYLEQRNNQDSSLSRTFRLVLDQKALDHIETLRDKNKKGDVIIQLDINISWLTTQTEVGSYSTERLTLPDQQNKNNLKLIDAITLASQNPNTMQGHLRMLVEQQGNSFLTLSDGSFSIIHTIHGSDWINDFQPQLGIGKFLVMEIPEIISVNEPKNKLEERLHSASQNLLKIQISVRKGEWEEVAEDCRAVYENLRSKDFREEFDLFVRKLLRDANGISDKGIGDFMQMIEGQNGFIHEFHHVIDKEGNPKRISVHKEDAYALYISLVGLVNMLTSKYYRLKKLESK